MKKYILITLLFIANITSSQVCYNYYEEGLEALKTSLPCKTDVLINNTFDTVFLSFNYPSPKVGFWVLDIKGAIIKEAYEIVDNNLTIKDYARNNPIAYVKNEKDFQCGFVVIEEVLYYIAKTNYFIIFGIVEPKVY